MFIVIIATIFSAGFAGLLVKYILDMRDSEARITWREFAIGMACTPALAGISVWAGWAIARTNNMTFVEYWNGWEISADKYYTTCTRDGPCRWEYDCDPYIVMVSYSCNCDSKGNCSTCYRPETRYHSCPYVDREYSYVVKTTLGEYPIASGVFPENPQGHRWRSYERIPGYVIDRAGVGDPPFWTAVQRRCESNTPGPVTKKNDYVNYILASEHTIMKQASADIADYKKAGLLPPLPKDIYSIYWANKVSFVGFKPANQLVWEKTLEYLNAALGNQLHGDLMLVVIKNSSVAANPERYSLALKAFWQDKTVHGKTALPKNEVVIILGTEDESTISWSRAFTAMPIGNEKLIVTLRDGLKGMPLDPERIIGPIASLRSSAYAVQYPPGEGSVLSRLLWGLDDPATKFKRISMSGKDGQGGFLYLKGEIQPTGGQIWTMAIVSFLLCMGVWIWAGIHRDSSEEGSSSSSRRFDYRYR